MNATIDMVCGSRLMSGNMRMTAYTPADTIVAAWIIALTGVGSRNIQVSDAEGLLVGKEPSAELISEASKLAAAAADPTADNRGSVEYKRNVVRVFTERALTESIRQAKGGAL